MLSVRNTLKQKGINTHTHTLHIKEWKTNYQENGYCKQAGITIFISDKEASNQS